MTKEMEKKIQQSAQVMWSISNTRKSWKIIKEHSSKKEKKEGMKLFIPTEQKEEKSSLAVFSFRSFFSVKNVTLLNSFLLQCHSYPNFTFFVLFLILLPFEATHPMLTENYFQHKINECVYVFYFFRFSYWKLIRRQHRLAKRRKRRKSNYKRKTL